MFPIQLFKNPVATAPDLDSPDNNKPALYDNRYGRDFSSWRDFDCQKLFKDANISRASIRKLARRGIRDRIISKSGPQWFDFF